MVSLSGLSELPKSGVLPKAIKDLYPILDLKEEQRRELSPINFVSSDDPPTLLIHGDKDTMVPMFASESMYQALLKAGVKTKLAKLPGVGHDEVSNKDADQIFIEAVNWFEEHLKVK